MLMMPRETANLGDKCPNVKYVLQQHGGQFQESYYFMLKLLDINARPNSKILGLKGELQCKTTQKGVREGAKQSLSSLIVSELIPLLRELRNFLEKVVLLDHRSAWKRNRIAHSLGGEGNRIVGSFGVLVGRNSWGGEKHKLGGGTLHILC